MKESEAQVEVESVFSHPDEFMFLASSPRDQRHILAATIKSEGGHRKLSTGLYFLPLGSSGSLTRDCLFGDCSSLTNGMFWESTENVVISDSEGPRMYRIGEDNPINTVKVPECSVSIDDPHHPFVVASAGNRSVHLWDSRTSSLSLTCKTSHFFPILSMDANPNLEHVFMTGGADGRMMFWDIRGTSGDAIKTVDVHNHYVTSVKYNQLHDELVLSAGTDCAVNLWSVKSIASSPMKHEPLVEKPHPMSPKRKPASQPTVKEASRDGLIQRYNRHEESIYRTCWAAGGSTWLFGSVSYDGLVMFNSVPSTEKYRIML